MQQLSHLQIRNPKDDETPIEAATQIFASLLPYPYIPLWKRWIIQPKTYAFEIYLISQTLYFYVTIPKGSETFVNSLISSSFPTSTTKKTADPMDLIFKSKRLSFGEVALNSYTYLPTKTYFDFKDVDPLSSLLGFLSKQPANLKIAIQTAITPAYFPWADSAVSAAHKLTYDEMAARYGQNPQRVLIMKKASFQGGKTAIRLLVGTTDGSDSRPYLTQLAATFGSFSLGEGNQYVFKIYPRANKADVKKAIEKVFGVDVTGVKVINIPKKKRRLGKIKGFKEGYKKAIVKIKEGQKIEVLSR